MSKRMSHEEWMKKHGDKIHPTLTILGRYTRTNEKIKVKCNLCDKIYYTFPYVLSKGCMCKSCSIRKTHEEFANEMSIINPNISIIGRYKTDRDKVKVKCIVCGHEWYASPTHLLNNHGCPMCGFKERGMKRWKPQNEILDMINDISPDIEVIGELKGLQYKVLVSSKICGHKWEAKPRDLIYRHNGCPICSKSYGERKIYNYLKCNNVCFEHQKKFDDLFGVGDRKLSYDFYLCDYNLLIEFQGGQHEKPNEFFGGEDKFMIQKEHDKRKKDYANTHGINLLEIWYWDVDNINDILSGTLHINNNNEKSA